MPGSESYSGRRALDFVDAIEASVTSARIIWQFEKMIGDLGFHAYIMAGIPEAGQTLAQVTVANGWPATRHLRAFAGLRHSRAPRRACRPPRRDAAFDRDHGIRHQHRADRLLHRVGILVAAAFRAHRLEGPSARAAAGDGRHGGA